MDSFRCGSCGASFHEANSLTTLQCGHSRCLIHEGRCMMCQKSSYASTPITNWSLKMLKGTGEIMDSMCCFVCHESFNESTCIPTTLECGHSCCMQDIPQYRESCKRCFCNHPAPIPVKFVRDVLMASIATANELQSDTCDEVILSEQEAAMLKAIRDGNLSLSATAALFAEVVITTRFGTTLAEAGGITLLLKLLSALPEKVTPATTSTTCFLGKLLKDLCTISSANHTYCEDVIALGGIDTLVGILTIYMASTEGEAENVLLLLVLLLAMLAAGSEDRRVAVEESGVLAPLLELMKSRFSERLKSGVKNAIAYITVPSSHIYSKNDFEAFQVAKINSVRYGNEREVGRALITLRCWAILTGKSSQLRILNSIGAQYLALLLKNPSLSAANKGHVVQLIETIVADNADTTARCVSAGIVHPLVELLQGEAEPLREVVAVALYKMCAQDLLFRLAMMECNLQVLVYALLNSAVAVRSWLGKIFILLCRDGKENQLRIVQDLSISFLITKLGDAHTEAKAAAWLLCRLMENNEQVQQVAVTADVIPALVKALSTDSPPKLRSHAAKALSILSAADVDADVDADVNLPGSSDRRTAVVKAGALLALAVSSDSDPESLSNADFALDNIMKGPLTRLDVSSEALQAVHSLVSELPGAPPQRAVEIVRMLKYFSKRIVAADLPKFKVLLAAGTPALLWLVLPAAE